MKQKLLIGLTLLLCSPYMFAKTPPAGQDKASQNPNTEAAKPTNAEQENNKPKKPSMADFCREHTC